MADIADVTSTLATLAANALSITNGVSSITNALVRIFEGWPIPGSLDPDLSAGYSNVSIFPPPGATASIPQVLNETYVITPPAYGLSVSISGDSVTLSGAPGAGEFCTIVVNNRFAYSRSGSSIAAILSAIASDAGANFSSGVSVSGNTITFPTSELVVHLGAPGLAGKATHRQRDSVMITVWAPTPAHRNALAQAIDVALKAQNHLTFADTSMGVLTFSHHHQIDDSEKVSCYRRDLVYFVEYATLETFTVYPITSFNPTIDAWPSSAYGSPNDDVLALG